MFIFSLWKKATCLLRLRGPGSLSARFLLEDKRLLRTDHLGSPQSLVSKMFAGLNKTKASRHRIAWLFLQADKPLLLAERLQTTLFFELALLLSHSWLPGRIFHVLGLLRQNVAKWHLGKLFNFSASLSRGLFFNCCSRESKMDEGMRILSLQMDTLNSHSDPAGQRSVSLYCGCPGLWNHRWCDGSEAWELCLSIWACGCCSHPHVWTDGMRFASFRSSGGRTCSRVNCTYLHSPSNPLHSW